MCNESTRLVRSLTTWLKTTPPNLRSFTRRNKYDLLAIFALLCVAVYISRHILYQSGYVPTGPDNVALSVVFNLFGENFWRAGWWPYGSLGRQWIYVHPWLFAEVFLIKLVGVNLAWRLWLFSIPLMVATGMYVFVRQVQISHIAAFISGLFYILNPVFLIGFTEGQISITTPYAFLPLILLCWIKATNGNRAWMAFAGILTPAFLLGNDPSVQLIFGTFFAFFILFNIVFARKRGTVLKNLFFTSILCVPLSIPFFYFVSYKLSYTFYIIFIKQAHYTISSVGYWSYDSLFSAISLLFRYQLSEPYALYTTGLPLYLKMIIFLVVPILAFSYVILARKNKMILFFGIVALISIFLSKGPNGPLGETFTWIYNNFPFFNFIRVYQRWGYVTVFCYAFLIGCFSKKVITRWSLNQNYIILHVGLSIKIILSISKKHMKVDVITKFLVCMIFISLAFSYANASVNLEYPKAVSPPKDYSAPFEWIEENDGGDYRILVVPFSYQDLFAPWCIRSTDFGGYTSLPIHRKPIVQYNLEDVFASPYAGNFLRYLNRLVEDNRTDKIAKIVGYMTNVKYVILQSYAENKEKEFFKQQDGLVVVYRNDNYAVLKNEYFRPHFTSAFRPLILFGDLDALLSLMYIETFDTSSGAVFSANQILNDTFDEIKNLDPLLTLYEITTENTSQLTQIIDGEEWKGWDTGYRRSPDGTLPSIKKVSDTVMKGTYALRIDIISNVGSGMFIVKTFAQPQDWSNYEFLSFYWYGQGSGKRIEVVLRDANKNQRFYYFNDDWTGWQRVMILLDKPVESSGSGNFNWMKVKFMFFEFLWEGTQTFYMDEIKIEEQRYPLYFLENVNRWVQIFEAEHIFDVTTGWDVLRSPGASGGEFVSAKALTYIFGTFHIPKSGEYKLSIRLSRLEEYPQTSLPSQIEGPAPYLILNIDGEEKSVAYPTSTQFQWIDTQPIHLDGGPHQISIQAVGSLGFDVFSIFKDANENFLEMFRINGDNCVKSVEMKDPSNYIIKVEARRPFILAFHEAYDPNWVAITDDNILSSKLSYYCLNAFIMKISGAGESTIQIKYTKQSEIVNLWNFSFLALMICYLPIFWNVKSRLTMNKRIKGEKNCLSEFDSSEEGEAEHERTTI